MLAAAIRLYFDENMSSTVVEEPRKRGMDVITVQELGVLGDTDINHLSRATTMGCVLCTQDEDFLQLASQDIEHTGIVFGRQLKHGIGDWVKGLELICAVYTPEDMHNHVEYL